MPSEVSASQDASEGIHPSIQCRIGVGQKRKVDAVSPVKVPTVHGRSDTGALGKGPPVCMSVE